MTERRRAERRRAEIDWKFYKKVFWLALPIALQSLITIGVNMLDTIMVGILGEMSLSAVSLANQFIGVYQIFCMGLGMGASVLVSRYWGMQEAEPVKSIQALRKTICIVVRITVSLALLFAVVTLLIPQVVMRMYTQDAEIIRLGEIYFRFSVITYFFLGLSLVCTIILRCVGQVKLPLLVSIGAFFVNLLANYVFIFGKLGMPRMGIAGAAAATVVGQIVAALIVMRRGFRKSPALSVYLPDIRKIYKMGIPNILMQSAYTFYIFGLNMVLATFSDQAVTVLGLYYKWQAFFFIPLGAMQTCIVPILSYNYATMKIDRCKKTLSLALIYGVSLMMIGVLCFELMPGQMLHVFSHDAEVIRIGKVAFRIIAVSFIPLVTSLTFPVFFQAVGKAFTSSMLTVIRTVFLFVPLGYAFSRIGLNFFWLTFPVTDIITSIAGFLLYRRFLRFTKSS